ncbi:MAG: double-strand break repair protein AddB [Rhodospirillales bacterium]|nr:double-strand break repair protein AddB [Rhodospirillales bacterium]
MKMPLDSTVYSIEPNIAFLDILAAGLLDRHGDQKSGLSNVQVYLPNRRACRGLAEAFLRQGDGSGLLLPKLIPLGEVESADELLISEDQSGLKDSLNILPTISSFNRLLALSRLIIEAEKKKSSESISIASAVRLASSLVVLLEEVETEQLDFSNLPNLVESDYATHWQLTLKFLGIISEQWPRVLNSLGCENPAKRRNILSSELIKSWRRHPPSGPVYAAGSTGSIPATASILVAIANLPRGAVILPGYDLSMDENERNNLPITHPQFGMARLVELLELKSCDIKPWSKANFAVCSPDRVHLIRTAMTSSDADVTVKPSFNIKEALSNVNFISCPSPQEEAGVIALAMREVLETPGRTAALVTPDRQLARRVASELSRWGIVIDDSAGQSLSLTPIGTFLNLSAVCFSSQLAPIPLLSFLKHPLATNGLKPDFFQKYVRLLERLVFRGPRPGSGSKGIEVALTRLSQETDDKRKETKSLIEWFDNWKMAITDLEKLFLSKNPVPLLELIDTHMKLVEEFAATDQIKGSERLWCGDDGEIAASFITEFREAAKSFPAISPQDYPTLLELLMTSKIVRPRFGAHPRLHIWGLLEARLQKADLMCMGGLNETVWPSESRADPWMSRPMRQQFGLPSGDRRVGLSAHDFVQSFCSEEVLITRAERVEGTPTVPARWLLRLFNVLKEADKSGNLLDQIQIKGNKFLTWQSTLDYPDLIKPCEAPSPCPPISARPRRLSVTQIETWMRDPYAIYARHILNLRPLDEIDGDPSIADRGTMIHEALERFVSDYPSQMPFDVSKVLRDIGIAAFGNALAYPSVWAFWWPRYERIIDWFAANEVDYRKTVHATHTEVTGLLKIQSDYGQFTLVAKADRIDELKDGTISIIDYKTGASPNASDVLHGFSPQLPLEVVIAEAGGFEKIMKAKVSILEVWRIGGGDPPGERHPVGTKIEDLAGATLHGLTNLIKQFDNPKTPYLSQPDPTHAPGWSDYAHLARVLEWSSVERADN